MSRLCRLAGDDRGGLDLTGFKGRDATHHLRENDLELLIDFRFQHAALDPEIELPLHIGGNPLCSIIRQAAGVDRVQIRSHGVADRGHAAEHVVVALPLGER